MRGFGPDAVSAARPAGFNCFPVFTVFSVFVTFHMVSRVRLGN